MGAPEKSGLLDLTLQLHAMTDRAVRVSTDGDEARAAWLPLSQCEVLRRPRGQVLVTLPEWLAMEKELV